MCLRYTGLWLKMQHKSPNWWWTFWRTLVWLTHTSTNPHHLTGSWRIVWVVCCLMLGKRKLLYSEPLNNELKSSPEEGRTLTCDRKGNNSITYVCYVNAMICPSKWRLAHCRQTPTVWICRYMNAFDSGSLFDMVLIIWDLIWIKFSSNYWLLINWDSLCSSPNRTQTGVNPVEFCRGMLASSGWGENSKRSRNQGVWCTLLMTTTHTPLNCFKR